MHLKLLSLSIFYILTISSNIDKIELSYLKSNIANVKGIKASQNNSEIDNDTIVYLPDIPNRPQAKESPPQGWCGEACIQMVSIYYGTYIPQSIIHDIPEPIYPDLHSNEIPIALDRIGLKNSRYSNPPYANVNDFIDWIKSELDQNFPVIIGCKIYPTYHPEWYLDHFMVAVGYTQNELIFNTTWNRQDSKSFYGLTLMEDGLSFENEMNYYYGISVKGFESDICGNPMRIAITSETYDDIQAKIIVDSILNANNYQVFQFSDIEKSLNPKGLCNRNILKAFQTTDSIFQISTQIHPDSISIFRCIPAEYTPLHDTICEGETVQIGEQFFSEYGEHIITLKNQQGCDSVILLNLTVNPIYEMIVDTTICEGENYNGWTETGTYRDTLSTVSGCDSIIVTNLTVNPVYETEEAVSICEGSEYNGWTEPGQYIDSLLSVSGCDSVIITNLEVNPVYETIIDTTICEGDFYKGRTESGLYVDSLISISGCDSIITTNLTVNPIYEMIVDTTICEGENYNGWTETGTYRDTLSTVSGCDSIIVTTLTVNPVYETEEAVSICKGSEYNGWTEPGQYIDSLLSVSGCDSVIITNLEVNPVYETIIDTTICEGDFYKGWTETGIYYDSLLTITGCDSVIITSLTVNPVYNIMENVDICEGSSHKGWTESSTYKEYLQSISGCDSTVITNLMVFPNLESHETISICQGESYRGFSTSGTHYLEFKTIHDCDSLHIIDLTVNPSHQPEITLDKNTLSTPDQYQSYEWYKDDGTLLSSESTFTITESGGYYLVVTDENGCTNSSEVFNAVFTSTNSFAIDNFKYSIIPIPNTGKFTFRIDSNIKSDLKLKLINTIGQVIEMREVEPTVNHTEQFDVSHLSKGIYYLVISSDQFQRSEKIVVQ